MLQYTSCSVCPRNCKVNRDAGQSGFCRESSQVRIARASLHMWEEPCISGTKGSGTVFFSGCNLKCIFCQNAQIALGETGKAVSIERLAEIFLLQQERGAHNINLVTPTHFIPSIVKALDIAKEKGLTLPILYNSSGYESIGSLKELEGYIDIYLPDFKYVDSRLSAAFSNAPDYFDVASAAIEEMFRQVGECRFDDEGLLRSGLVVRHLVLPQHTKDSKAVVRYLYEKYGDSIYISLMSQYTPMPHILSNTAFPELHRKITKKEYDSVVDYAISLGLSNGFIQEGETAKESFIPPFDLSGF